MDIAKKAYSLLKEHEGYLSAKEARANGLSNKAMQRLTDRGLVERAAHGLYAGTDVFLDPYFITQYRCPQGVFSHETALYFHNLSDRTPSRLMLTIPSGWNTRLLASSDVLIFYNNAEYAALGTEKIVTPYGRTVTVYSAPRTICDCLRSIDKLDKDLVLTALKRHIRNPTSDKTKLLEFATLFKIRDLVMRYMEVLV